MELLYKYYSNESEYAYENLENRKICFSPLESLNDPLEGLGAHAYEVSEKESEYWAEIGSNLPENSSKIFTKDVWEVLNFKYRVFCSTKEYNNPLLWAYYANSHKGFCVGYDKEDILKISKKLNNIDYSETMCSINNFNNETLEQVLYTKSSEWSRENECRVLYELEDYDVEHLDPNIYLSKDKKFDQKIRYLNGHVQRENLETICAEKFILKDCSPKVIYIGMKMKSNDREKLIGIANKLKIKIYQITQEKNTFKFVAKKII